MKIFSKLLEMAFTLSSYAVAIIIFNYPVEHWIALGVGYILIHVARIKKG